MGKRVNAACAVMLFVCAGTARGQGGDDEPLGSAMSVSVGVDMPSQYFARGLRQETGGWITQPWVQLGVNLMAADTESDFGGLDLSIGSWNSLHEGRTGSGSGGGPWYESDFYLGLSSSIDNVSLGAVYTAYSSPNGQFSTTQELAVTASLDDSSWWGDSFSGVQPAATLAIELDGTAFGNESGTYLGLGLSPTFQLSEEYAIQMTVPVTLGLGLDDYYENATTGDDDFFGYFDVGVDLSMPISTEWISPRFGAWSLSASVHALFLDGNTQIKNNGDDFELIATIGVSTSF